MRTETVYYNVHTRKLLRANGTQLSTEDYPSVLYKELMVFNVVLVTDSNLTRYENLSGALYYTAVIDKDISWITSVAVKSTNGLFNIDGDWIADSGGQAFPEQGELSFRVDGNTVRFQTIISGRLALAGWCEIKVFQSIGGTLLEVHRFPVVMRGLIEDDGEVPAAVSDSGFRAGVVSIPSGVDTVSVTGLALVGISPTTPILISISAPLGDSSAASGLVFPVLDRGSITEDGFDVMLNGITPSAGFRLHYAVFG